MQQIFSKCVRDVMNFLNFAICLNLEKSLMFLHIAMDLSFPYATNHLTCGLSCISPPILIS